MDTCWTNVEDGAIWRLRVEGPCLNGARVERLREELRRVNAIGAKGVIIDLQRVDRLDPLGLAGLTLLPKDIKPPARLALAGLRPELQEAALLVHLHEVVDIYEGTRAAVCDLSAPTSNP